ncbi:hypothetical protein [Asanoa sp. NPDC050611]|uniref:hypothetical protein n=1 Tax=Asanoa sp. NPDC050611 TaxID=3157098 RepID=UPI0034074100
MVTVRHRRPDGRGLRLHIPVLPVLLLLSPLLLLAALAGLVACLYFRVNPVGAVRGAAQLLSAMRGTRVEIEQGRVAVLVSVN